MDRWSVHDVVVMVDEHDEDNVTFWTTLSVTPYMATVVRFLNDEEPVYLTVVGHLTTVCFPVRIVEESTQESYDD